MAMFAAVFATLNNARANRDADERRRREEQQKREQAASAQQPAAPSLMDEFLGEDKVYG